MTGFSEFIQGIGFHYFSLSTRHPEASASIEKELIVLLVLQHPVELVKQMRGGVQQAPENAHHAFS